MSDRSTQRDRRAALRRRQEKTTAQAFAVEPRVSTVTVYPLTGLGVMMREALVFVAVGEVEL